MAGLRTRALSGMQWTIAGRLMKSGLGIAILAVLSRYLTPAEFGVMALVTFITGFAQIFVDFGLRVSLVQRTEVTARQQNTVFWTNLVMSFVMMGAVWLFASWIAESFQAGRVEPLVRAMSFVFPLIGLQIVSLTVLERQFAFARIASSDMVSTVLSGIAVVAMVVMGAGVWALVGQQLIQAAVSTAMLIWFARWRPRAEFSFADLRRLFSYGGYVTLTNLVSYFNSNFDRPIIAGAISPQVLGYFTVAQQAVAAPFRIVVTMAKKVLFPILSSLQKDRERMASAYLDIQHAIVAVMAPACIGLAAVAQPFVDVVLGPQWHPAAPLISLIALQMLLIPVAETNQTVLAAMGRARFQFIWMVFGTILSLGALWLFIGRGIEAAILARMAVSAALMPVLSGYTMRQIGLPLHSLMRVLWAPVLAAATMGAVVWLTLARLPWPPFVQLLICVPLGAGLYTGILLLIDRRRALALWRMVRRRG